MKYLRPLLAPHSLYTLGAFSLYPFSVSRQLFLIALLIIF